MISGRFYSLADVREKTGLSSQRVIEIARDEGWEYIKAGTIFPADEVDRTLWARARRDLAREMGVWVRGPVYHDEWDREDNCPICGDFAIYRPASQEEIKNLELPIYTEGWPWRCIQGHNQESEE